VLFSCKISHAVLLHIERQNEDLERLEQTLYEKFDLPPIEFLKDPSCWLKSKQMEDFLEHVVTHYKSSIDDLSLLSFVGHHSKDLRAWGVLDSVLRMLQSPQDVFLQPQRFLSYFVSPPPPVANVKHDENSVVFDLPIASHEFPRVVEYLKAAIESLPTYLGQSLAHVVWEDSRLSIEWCTRQANLLEEIQAEKALHPELMQDILHDLEHSQKQIEQLQLSLQSKTEELELLRKGMGKLEPASPESRIGQSLEMNLDSEIAEVQALPVQGAAAILPAVMAESVEIKLQESLQSLYRLADYMARGQQLVTMLVGQNRSTPQVKEAMRRVDWERVQNSSILHFKEVIGHIQDLNQVIKNSAKLPPPVRNDYQNKISSDQTQWII
jgi:hypothetical protein